MTTDNSVKALLPDFERACALAARACLPWVGQGDKEAADAAAVDAMRTAFNAAPMHGRIVIGEGERDQAPMPISARPSAMASGWPRRPSRHRR